MSLIHETTLSKKLLKVTTIYILYSKEYSIILVFMFIMCLYYNVYYNVIYKSKIHPLNKFSFIIVQCIYS